MLSMVRREVERVAALGRSLEPTEWSRPSRCDDWTVADVFGHLCNDFERFDAWLTQSLAGALDPPFAPDEFRADNAALLERFAGVPGPERLAEMEEAARRWLDRAATIDPDTPQRHPRGTITVGTQTLWAAGECAIHGWDVATALDRAWPPPEGVGLIAARFALPVPESDDPWSAVLRASGRTP